MDVYGSKFVDSLNVVSLASTGGIVLNKENLFDKYGILLIFHRKDFVEADSELLKLTVSKIATNQPIKLLFYDVIKDDVARNYLENSLSLCIGSLTIYGIRNVIPSGTMKQLEFVHELIQDCASKCIKGLLHVLALHMLCDALNDRYSLSVIDFLKKLANEIINESLIEVIGESESDYLEYKKASFFNNNLEEIANRLVHKLTSVPFKIILSASDEGKLSFLPSTHPLTKSDVRHSLERRLRSMLKDYKIKIFAIPKDKGVAIVIIVFKITNNS